MRIATLSISSLLLISTAGSGCCGVLTPTKENMTARMAPLVGHPAGEAVSVLKWSGFTIEAQGPEAIIATYKNECLFMRDFVGVSVRLDEKGRIIGSEIDQRRMLY